MSSVSVSFGVRTIKLKTTPSTPVKELIERSVSHFKLNATDSYDLFHQSTKLSNLPIRLLNLPQGAKLTLKQSSVKASLIQIKINVLNNPQNETGSVVKKVLDSITLKDLIEELEKDLKFSIIGSSYKVKLQSMTGVLENNDSSFGNFQDSTLKSFGLDNNSLLRLTFIKQMSVESNSTKKETPKPVTTQREEEDISSPGTKKYKQDLSTSTSSTPVPTPDVINLEEPEATTQSESVSSYEENIKEDQVKTQSESDIVMVDAVDAAAEEEDIKDEVDIKVFKAGEHQVTAIETSDSVYDISIPQLKSYQQLLSKRAHESTRQAQLKRSQIQKSKIENLKTVNVRIKFPNLIFVDFNISSSKTQQDLYSYVSETFLTDKSIKFELYTPHPFTLLDRNDNQLIQSFESRNLLLFQTNDPIASLIKQEYLQIVKDISETAAVKLELERQTLPDEDTLESNSTTSKSNSQSMRKSQTEYDDNNPVVKSRESKLKNLLRLSKR
ncbi:hypothetical protein WICPIJ_005792 [Wickerhamomyces pijperi]|uniref:UBX domain-containing protein n=1 Tax=Wickerhamomyces pijperi TaxID=599730 RepID=A0A9P8Q5M5_WICPI|nr:hypothetical protein WICPIJ_005792 [Wickerhamomyces pijperi]